MAVNKIWINRPPMRLLQHLSFWALSFYAFLHVFKTGSQVEKIDYVYTTLFHATIIPAVYINLELLLPRVKQTHRRWWYIPGVLILALSFAWINYGFFEKWSNAVLPDYFFISYFSYGEVVLFFTIYLIVTSLLKLSKSWFAVNNLEKQLLIAEKKKAEFELKALRSQMNPHFIFNCMNSIKSLIQRNEQEKSVDYLTTFSRLLRTILQNSDQKEISLFDEVETCRLYTQLESMRFGNKLKYSFVIDNEIDLKSLKVPALIIQPFIENAIWHGIMPKETGGTVTIRVEKRVNKICCIIEDDGIGREMSRQNKFSGRSPVHQSKGLHLTQSRLDLDNTLNERSGSIEIIDKADADGSANGTSIILTFNQY
jgi:anti-sigma regulatory factor (Ser/Thr protein kinase)